MDLSKSFDTINRNKVEFILHKYGIPTEILNDIMIVYMNTLYIVRSPDGDIQGDTLVHFLFIIFLGFTLTKRRSRQHPYLHLLIMPTI